MSASASRFNQVTHHIPVIIGSFKKYLGLFNNLHKKDLKMVDIGTGPGQVLYEVNKYITKDYKEIMCLDKSDMMFDYFNSLEKDPRISGVKCDLEREDIPNDLEGRFDFAFSSFCFQYVLNLRQAFKNCSKMLNSDGELFFIFPKRSFVYDNYQFLSYLPKWAPYLKEFRNLPVRLDTDDPIGTLTEMFEELDLEILQAEDLKDVIVEENTVEDFLEVYDSMDFAAERIPKCDLEDYKKAYHALSSTRIIMDEKRSRALHPFPLIVVAGKKRYSRV